MGIASWFQRLRESMNRKKHFRMQLSQQPTIAVVSAGPSSSAAVWTTSSTVDLISSTIERPTGGGVRPGAILDDSALMGPPEPAIRYMADIPGDLRDRIQQEGMARVLRRLETPLRALNMATSRKGVNYSAEELRGFLLMWRQALADYAGLMPDERSVIVYDRTIDEAYFVRGRCEVGTTLTVVEPCWKLNGEVIIRGEAQVIQGWVR